MAINLLCVVAGDLEGIERIVDSGRVQSTGSGRGFAIELRKIQASTACFLNCDFLVAFWSCRRTLFLFIQ